MSFTPYRTAARSTTPDLEKSDPSRAVAMVLVAAAALMIASALRPTRDADTSADARGGTSHAAHVPSRGR